MTTLFDFTVQHSGWATDNFTTGGWEDWFAPLATGLQAQSYWCSTLNGQIIDQAAGFTSGGATSSNYWFNVHRVGEATGATIPSPFLVTPGTQINTFTRVPASNEQIFYRMVVSDQPTTPPPTDPPCKYGTQTQSNVPGAIVITAPLIDVVLTSLGVPELAILFAVIQGMSLAVVDLCGSGPPPFVELSGDPSLNSIGTLLQDFKAVAWPYFCQCVPGSPAPINFPPPQVVVPPNLASAPTWPCDPNNLCASISQILATLTAIQGTLASDYQLTTLLQRYRLPFALIPGAIHSGLTSFGTFNIPRCAGISYQVDQLPPDAVIRPGVNQYIRDLGWIGVTLPGGGVAEHRVTRQQEFWLPENIQSATSFGWDLTPGTQITVRELYAEP